MISVPYAEKPVKANASALLVIEPVKMATTGTFVPFTMLLFWGNPIIVWAQIFVDARPNNLKSKSFQ
jgi:hypothetical protein